MRFHGWLRQHVDTRVEVVLREPQPLKTRAWNIASARRAASGIERGSSCLPNSRGGASAVGFGTSLGVSGSASYRGVMICTPYSLNKS